VTFAIDVSKFAQKAKSNANLVVRKVTFDASTSLVEKSPVGDAKFWKKPPPKGYVGGRFRANWQFGEGQINDLTTDSIDPEGEATISRITAAVPQDALGKVLFVTNSLPYAWPLEHGHSRQAPFGFVGQTVLAFNLFIAKAVSELP
jgi:hypothetical protein